MYTRNEWPRMCYYRCVFVSKCACRVTAQEKRETRIEFLIEYIHKTCIRFYFVCLVWATGWQVICCKRATNYRALLRRINASFVYIRDELPCMCYRVTKTQDALSCRSFSAKQPRIIGLFCGKWPIKIRHPMGLRHHVLRMCVCVTVCACRVSAQEEIEQHVPFKWKHEFHVLLVFVSWENQHIFIQYIFHFLNTCVCIMTTINACLVYSWNKSPKRGRRGQKPEMNR